MGAGHLDKKRRTWLSHPPLPHPIPGLCESCFIAAGNGDLLCNKLNLLRVRNEDILLPTRGGRLHRLMFVRARRRVQTPLRTSPLVHLDCIVRSLLPLTTLCAFIPSPARPAVLVQGTSAARSPPRVGRRTKVRQNCPRVVIDSTIFAREFHRDGGGL